MPTCPDWRDGLKSEYSVATPGVPQNKCFIFNILRIYSRSNSSFLKLYGQIPLSKGVMTFNGKSPGFSRGFFSSKSIIGDWR